MKIPRKELNTKYFHGGQAHIWDEDSEPEPFKALMMNSLWEKKVINFKQRQQIQGN